jgi:hypothetical protein
MPRAFGKIDDDAWRGRKVIERNLKLLSGRADGNPES